MAATLLNSLTAKADTRTVIEIQTRQAHLVFVSTATPPPDLDVAVRFVQGRVQAMHRSASGVRATHGSSSVRLDSLERLTALKQAGALSDDEFHRAKAMVLGESAP